MWVDKFKEFRAHKRRISIPFKVQQYITKKCSNKCTGGKGGISLNYLISKINRCTSLRKKLNFCGKISKSSLHRFIHNKFGKPYRLRKIPKIKPEHTIKKKGICSLYFERKNKWK